MAAYTQDDGFHEIQLNGKQLVFLFMAATVVSVVIFLCGVLVVKETMPTSRWLGFSIVWLALAVFTYDSIRTARATRGRDSARTLDHVVT